MASDPLHYVHLEWLGYVQPVGLVVSAPALTAAQAYPNKNILREHGAFVELVEDSAIRNIEDLLLDVLGWEKEDFVVPAAGQFEVALPEYGETLRPTYAVWDVDAEEGATGRWLMLIKVEDRAIDLDAVRAGDGWQASPQAKFERLLRESEIPAGLLFNGTHLRLVYAPRGESSGYITFSVRQMTEVAGRPIFSAMKMLLSAERLFSLDEKQRLPALLSESRKYQSFVSTRLSEQVLAALYELLRGFQAADELRKGELLRAVLRDDPNKVYNGLLTVLMRLVFALYAEDRGLVSNHSTYINHYSVTGLFERLRADAGRYADTMDQRFGAWGQLLALFRLIYEGGSHGDFRLPARRGYLFDPDRYPFLEGGRPPNPPSVSDGVVYRVLQNLTILDGERLSYRSLDVEQIGSVYETMMGFSLEVAKGPSIAIKATKSRGAPSAINLLELLKTSPTDRARWVREKTDQSLAGEPLERLKSSRRAEDLVAALEKKVAREATPNIVPAGAMVLQPSEERRKSGSHYTPRSLTAPIVKTTLRPILEALGPKPKPDQILALKVLDLAMGSGAFLVEACRQLAEVLVKAWHVHRCVPRIPSDEDELMHAQRLIAQQCLYGVDRNPMAVDLAKLSLWLATLSKDHPFTFLDHSLRCGDSLVGLTTEQIAGFHWEPKGQVSLVQPLIEKRLSQAKELRARIRQAGETASHAELANLLIKSDEALDDVRLIGNVLVSAFFGAEKPKEREKLRSQGSLLVHEWLKSGKGRDKLVSSAAKLREWNRPVEPFHWNVEFPEVFAHGRGGFDAIVGNPPFLGGKSISTNHGDCYRDWLASLHEESNSSADLVAHFYRRTFSLLRAKGTFGLIATKTIRQGDTRATGLRWICTHDGTVYDSTRRIKWPGEAAVVVSIVHVGKGLVTGRFILDGREVPLITAFLFHAGGHEDPARLAANAEKSFQGSILLGMGFTFDDSDKKGVASPISEMHRLIQKDKRNKERILPYIGGEEVNDSPTHAHHRYAIDFFDRSLKEAEEWPDLIGIVRERVKPERDGQKRDALRERWWQYADKRPGLYNTIRGMKRVLVISRVTEHPALVFLPTPMIYADRLVVFPFESDPFFAILQSRVHEVWARFFSATLEDRLMYALSDCFETFPFPGGIDKNSSLEAAGRVYYGFRAALMVRNDEGLTKTYNRFHDPDESSPDIVKLRELHAAMDRAVLDAYGWTDLTPTCGFFLEYEEEDEEAEDSPSRRKKPWRYRWPDETHDEVLARLLELNRKRADQERLSAIPQEKIRAPKSPKRKKEADSGGLLFQS